MMMIRGFEARRGLLKVRQEIPGIAHRERSKERLKIKIHNHFSVFSSTETEAKAEENEMRQ